jgi:hypothetical protein
MSINTNAVNVKEEREIRDKTPEVFGGQLGNFP